MSMDSRDRRFVRQLVTGTVKWRQRLDWIVDQFARRPIASLPTSRTRNLLRLGVYQLLMLDRVPDRAAVHTTVDMAKRYGGRGFPGFVNAVLRRVSRDTVRYPEREEDLAAHLSIVHSHPRWLVERWLGRWGETATEALLTSNNEPARLFVRLNALRPSDASPLRALLPEDLADPQPAGLRGDCLELSEAEGLFDSQAYHQGMFFVQDANAGLAARLLEPQPGERVLDVCSAPGGKAVQMAIDMGDRGFIAAADLSVGRLQRVLDNAARLGLSSLRAIAENGEVPSADRRQFDRVLVDAPCSSTGVFARRADARWRRTPSDITHCARRQLRLLRRSYERLGPDGVLVYSTCTLEREENEAVVDAFLADTPSARVEHASEVLGVEAPWCGRFVQTLPGRECGDGSFAARLRKAR